MAHSAAMTQIKIDPTPRDFEQQPEGSLSGARPGEGCRPSPYRLQGTPGHQHPSEGNDGLLAQSYEACVRRPSAEDWRLKRLIIKRGTINERGNLLSCGLD